MKDSDKSKEEGNDKKFPGYPHYSADEDIYRQEKELEDVDPETRKRKKTEKDFPALDVPGAELDDAQEKIGNEDEENNYYSLGGDDSENLEENNDEFYPDKD